MGWKDAPLKFQAALHFLSCTCKMVNKAWPQVFVLVCLSIYLYLQRLAPLWKLLSREWSRQNCLHLSLFWLSFSTLNPATSNSLTSIFTHPIDLFHRWSSPDTTSLNQSFPHTLFTNSFSFGFTVLCRVTQWLCNSALNFSAIQFYFRHMCSFSLCTQLYLHQPYLLFANLCTEARDMCLLLPVIQWPVWQGSSNPKGSLPWPISGAQPVYFKGSYSVFKWAMAVIRAQHIQLFRIIKG